MKVLRGIALVVVGVAVLAGCQRVDTPEAFQDTVVAKGTWILQTVRQSDGQYLTTYADNLAKKNPAILPEGLEFKEDKVWFGYIENGHAANCTLHSADYSFDQKHLEIGAPIELADGSDCVSPRLEALEAPMFKGVNVVIVDENTIAFMDGTTLMALLVHR